MTIQSNPVSSVLGMIATDPNVSGEFRAAAGGSAGGIGDVLAELRAVIDAREELSRQDAELSKRRQDLERQLFAYQESSGVEKLAANGLSVSFDTNAMRVKYDPDRFVDIFKWAAETGNAHIIQRRFTDSRVIELVSSGIPLPEGLGLESFVKLSVRRT